MNYKVSIATKRLALKMSQGNACERLKHIKQGDLTDSSLKETELTFGYK